MNYQLWKQHSATGEWRMGGFYQDLALAIKHADYDADPYVIVKLEVVRGRM